MKLGEIEFLGWLAKREDLKYNDFVRAKAPLNRYGGIAYAVVKSVRDSLQNDINNNDALGYVRRALNERIESKAAEAARVEVPEQKFLSQHEYEHEERLFSMRKNSEAERMRKDIASAIDGESIESIGRSSAFLAYCDRRESTAA